MGFLSYSNKYHCNLIPQEEFEGLIKEVFGVISDNLKKSLGPLGSSATILDGMMTEATKDGYSILNKYRFHNRYKKMIYNLIKTPCTTMNNTVGDGTTTAIVLANAIFKRYQSKKNVIYTMYRLPRQFVQTWDKVIADLTEQVKNQSVMINPEDYDAIYNIAYVTSNGNHEISDAIASVYRDSKSPSIKMKNSPTNKSYIAPINGFDFPANLISDAFVRNQDLSVNEKDIHVMIFDHKIETDYLNAVILPLNEVFRARGTKLLVLAPYFDEYMCRTVVDQHINYEWRKFGFINLIMAQYPLDKDKIGKYQLFDLATVLRAKVIDQNLATMLQNKIDKDNIDALVEDILENEASDLYRFIGISAEAMLSCDTGSIFRVEGIEDDTRYQESLAHANRELEMIISQIDHERQSYASKIYKARARISQLEMKNFIYYIGADSALQRQITQDAVEDVIKCVRSAIKSGVVPGCQIAIMRACAFEKSAIVGNVREGEHVTIPEDQKLRYEIIRMIEDAVIDVYQYVLHGPDLFGIIKTIPRWQYAAADEEEEEARLDKLYEEARNKAFEIIHESVKRNQAFDMESLDYNPNIITSAETDTMVLSAASEVVKILISGNQCIFLDSEVNETHNDTMDAYV